MPAYADLHPLAEDARIQAIGTAASAGLTVGVLLERDEPEKIARYIRKLAEAFPRVEYLGQRDGPARKVVLLRFRGQP